MTLLFQLTSSMLSCIAESFILVVEELDYQLQIGYRTEDTILSNN